jgi:hypothetical protein
MWRWSAEEIAQAVLERYSRPDRFGGRSDTRYRALRIAHGQGQ